MPKKKDRINDCTEIKICVDNDLNELIEKFQAKQRQAGNKMTKPETVTFILTEALS